jgi:2-polyprenyl-3-methyl-5-hydroxy-6-metoxy-1,4-benzoquinol methylase
MNTGVAETIGATASTRQIIEISRRKPVNMHNAYFHNATLDHFWIQWRFEELKNLLHGRQLGEQILEVGTGHGVVAQQFESFVGAPVHGCDLNYDALQMAGSGHGNLYLYDVMDLCPEWESWFDTILLCDVLEHIDNSVEFLRALRYHLAPGGQLVINVPAAPWLYSRYDSVQGHVQRYSAKKLRSELALAGFNIERWSYWGSNLLPVAIVRKLMVTFMKDEQVMDKGFQPPSVLAEIFLRRLMELELGGFCIPNLGTSLCAVARSRTSKID